MLVISQPTYLPWIGYFALINESNKFVFLDDVQFNTRSWQQRNRILNTDKIGYLTLPIKKKGQQTQLINKSHINDKNIYKKHLKTIYHCYANTKYFKKYFGFFEEVLTSCEKFNYLSDVNIFLIKKICKLIDIDLNYTLSSSIGSKGKKTDKLIDICINLNQKKYLTNEGAMEYINQEKYKFDNNKIRLYQINVVNYSYNQKSNVFFEKLSIIDVIFNEGQKSKDIIKNSYTILDIK